MSSIHLGHCHRNTDGLYLLQPVLDAIQMQSEIDHTDALLTAREMSMWITEQQVNELLEAHTKRLEHEARRLAKQAEKAIRNRNSILYAFDADVADNCRTLWPVGRTTQDYERLKLSNQQWQDWVNRELERTDLSVSIREDLAGARYWLAKAKNIIIENNISRF